MIVSRPIRRISDRLPNKNHLDAQVAFSADTAVTAFFLYGANALFKGRDDRGDSLYEGDESAHRHGSRTDLPDM